MKQIMTKCMITVCIVILFCAVTACDGERYFTLAESEALIGDAALDSLMFSLDGVIYTLPVHYSELEANGWRAYDPDNNFATSTLVPGEHFSSELIAGNQNIGVTFTNLSDEVMPISESYISGVAILFRSGVLELHNAQLILPGNIMIGSTLEDVFAAYGDTATWMAQSEDSPILAIVYSAAYGGLHMNIDNENSEVVFLHFHYFSYVNN